MAAKNSLRRLERKLRAAVSDSLNEIVGDVAKNVEARVPRDTGGLADSLEILPAHSEGRSLAAEVSIGNPDHPAGPVEFGTAHQSPEPFWRPSLPRNPTTEILRSLR